jgi:hypothetical protein
LAAGRLVNHEVSDDPAAAAAAALDGAADGALGAALWLVGVGTAGASAVIVVLADGSWVNQELSVASVIGSPLLEVE